nr:hypothetical protein [Tanacetum cinerariifolium]
MTEAQQLKLVTKKSMQQKHISQASGSGADEGTGADNEGKDGDDDEEEGGDDEQEYDEEEYNEETKDEESFDPILKTPKNSDDEGSGEKDLGLNVGGGRKTPSPPMTAPTMTPSTIATITTTSQATILPTIVPSTINQNLPNFSSLFCFDDKLRSLEVNFSEAMQMNQFVEAVSAIPGIVQRYMDQRMNEAVKKIIKEHVKEQVKVHVKVQVFKILPRIEQTVNEQLEAEVLTRLSHSSKTSYVVAADLSEMELKKILIEKMEGNKSIRRSDEQRNLYKALDEEPSVGPDRGSKRRREGKEPESASAPTKTATRSAGSGKIVLAVGTILHYQWELSSSSKNFFWQWEHITGSGKTVLEVGMDRTFNSQQSSPKLDAASAIRRSRRRS